MMREHLSFTLAINVYIILYTLYKSLIFATLCAYSTIMILRPI